MLSESWKVSLLNYKYSIKLIVEMTKKYKTIEK